MDDDRARAIYTVLGVQLPAVLLADWFNYGGGDVDARTDVVV
nr:hypothetical protein [Cryobacterium sp. Y50]